MRLLHTADWHLGRATYNVPRADDHDEVIAEILDIARTEKPDLIVHAGDLFDAVRPAYLEMTRGIQALQELAAVAPVVVLCGNHDSPALFRIFEQLLGEESRIRFIDKARRPSDGGVLDFDLGEERVRLAPLPFVHANRVVEAFETEPSQWTSAYADRIHAIEDALFKGLLEGYESSRDILLFAAHLHVSGARFSGSERQVHVSENYASRLERLPQVSYAAFGHIHKPQSIPGTTPGRYAGSPIQLDFGELSEEKEVVMVEAAPGLPAKVTPVPLSGGRRLRKFEGSLSELAEAPQTMKRQLCLLTIQTEEPVPELSERVRELLPPDAVVLQVREDCSARAIEAVESVEAEAEASFEQSFREYLGEVGTKGSTVHRVLSTFETLLRAAEAEEEPIFEADREGAPHRERSAADREQAPVGREASS